MWICALPLFPAGFVAGKHSDLVHSIPHDDTIILYVCLLLHTKSAFPYKAALPFWVGRLISSHPLRYYTANGENFASRYMGLRKNGNF